MKSINIFFKPTEKYSFYPSSLRKKFFNTDEDHKMRVLLRFTYSSRVLKYLGVKTREGGRSPEQWLRVQISIYKIGGQESKLKIVIF